MDGEICKRKLASNTMESDRKRSMHEGHLKQVSLSEISIAEFVSCRAHEMQMMDQVATVTLGNNLVSQQLPRHMRRRAASHNMKRLPCRLRIPRIDQCVNKSKSTIAKKRPSRHYRRRHRTDTRDHSGLTWLETHLWHAKRFKMTSGWGYRLPLHPSNKGVRAAYRASAKYCLVQDVSFLCCIELSGDEVVMETGLRQLSSSDIGLTMMAKMYKSGARYGNAILYKPGEYPFGAIAQVQFMWQPVSDTHTSDVCLWLWVHPSAYSILLTQLHNVFAPISGKPNVTVTSLKDSLVRFRLTGPLSHSILIDTLTPAELSTVGDTCWWKKYYSDVQATSSHLLEIWESLSQVESTAELPPFCVVGLTVGDPRLRMPGHRKKITDCVKQPAAGKHGTPTDMTNCLSTDAHLSALWDADVREDVKHTKLTDAKLYAEYSKSLLPGTPADLQCSESQVPILLLQKPGCRAGNEILGYACGWDMLLPASWGKAFWLALVQRGARASGLREAASIDLQSCRLRFPDDFPDTEAGREENSRCRLEFKTKHERRPPAKRTNFTLYGGTVPFTENWMPLLKEWCHQEAKPEENCANFFVCRCRHSLTSLAISCRRSIKAVSEKQTKSRLEDLSPCIRQHAAMCLVPVRLGAHGRGTLPPFSMIVQPAPDDLRDNSMPLEVNCDKHATSRPLIGYISCGHFAFAVGEGRALGFVALYGLLALLRKQHASVQVLVCSSSSTHYRRAFLEVLVDD